MLRARRILLPALVFTLAAPVARALEGAPPFEWTPWGWPAPELSAAVTVAGDAGVGSGFAGAAGEQSMRVRDYAIAPFQVRYGVFPALEVYGVAQLVWASSPQQWNDAGSPGPFPTYRAVVSGFDGGDMAIGLRWGFWRGEGETSGAVLTGAFIFPSGSDVWSYPRATFMRTFNETPDLSTGDGTYKFLVGVELDAAGEEWGLEMQAGYLHKLPITSDSFTPYGDSISVHMPSPVTARIRPSWKVSDDLSILGLVEGYWAPPGKLVPEGRWANDPGALARNVGTYANLVAGEAEAWAGAGLRLAATSSVTAELAVAAPVAASRVWRQWRLGAAVTWNWKP